MVSKIKISVGNLTVDYEGDETYLRDELPGLIEKLAGLARHAVSAPAAQHRDAKPQQDKSEHSEADRSKLTIDEIAARTGGSKGTGLILSAAAWLTLSDGKQVFSRRELLEAVRLSAHYKKSDTNNLSPNIKALLKSQKLREPSSGQYGLTPTQKSSIEAALAE